MGGRKKKKKENTHTLTHTFVGTYKSEEPLELLKLDKLY